MGSGGFLGAGAESGFLNTGLFSSGPKKIKGFEMSQALKTAEQDMINRQAAIASGNAPSIAQMSFDKYLQDTQKAAMSMAASQRGASNPALAFRTAQLANQESQLQGAQQGAIMAEEERRQADQMIGAQAASQRGVALDQSKTNISNKLASQKQQADFLGNAGAAAAASDKNLKTDKKKTENSALDAVNEFLKSVEPYEYKYKGGDKTDRNGVMAQDLEKSRLGEQMVTDTPGGKVVDYGQGFSTLMASIAELNNKVEKLKKA